MNPGLERNLLFNWGHTQLTGRIVSISISQKQPTIKFYGVKIKKKKTLKMIVVLFFKIDSDREGEVF